MISNSNLVFLLLALSYLPACSVAPNGGEEHLDATPSSQPLTAADMISGFESSTAWSVTSGSAILALTTDHVEGTSALAISKSTGYLTVQSDATFTPEALDATVTLQVKPPPAHDHAPWKGQVQLFVDSPSRGLHMQPMGLSELSGLSAGVFGSIAFSIPPEIGDTLTTGSVNDVRYTLALNTPLSGPYLFDALRLGGAIADPTPTPNPKAYAGGRDVALVWKVIPWSRRTVRYDVYRNTQLIGTASPTVHAGSSAATYFDGRVVAGQTYDYQVQAVADDGARAALSAPVSITHPAASPPVPTILIDSDAYPSTRPYLEGGKPFLETWYPKIANILAYQRYAPPSTITLRADGIAASGKTCTGGYVDAGGPIVHICPGVTGDNYGLIVHEATHLIQAYQKPTLAAAGEGIASWAGNLAIGQDNTRPGPLFSYYDDYEYGAYFFDWIANTYTKPNFIRDLNLVSHDGTYTSTWLQQYTGYTLGQLFGTMMGTTFTSPGPIKTFGGRYAFPSDSSLSEGSKIYLLSQPPTSPARFFHGPISEGTGPLRWEKDVCLAEDAQGYVVVQKCSAGNPTLWRYLGPLNAFYNVTTSHCLMPQAEATQDGTFLVMTTCNASSSQRWQPLPL